MMLGVTIKAGTGAIRLGYSTADRSGGPAGSGFGNADDARLMAAGYVYNLSKRTDLYTTYARVSNKGARTSTVGSSGPVAGMRGGQTSSGYEFGITHRF